MPAANRHPSLSALAAGIQPALASATLSFVLGAAASLTAQDQSDAQAIAVADKAVTALQAFAKKAASRKALTHSRAAYQIVIEHYDADHAAAREALGFAKVEHEWRQTKDPATLPANGAAPRTLAQVEKDWQATCRKLAKLHRTLGLSLHSEGESEAAQQQLRRAIAFDADDVQSHQALGHKDIDGFYGDAAQLTFVRNMRAMLAKAKECAALPFASDAVAADQMPATLKQSGLPFSGARSEHFEHWVIGSDEQAQQSVVWAERALVMVRHLLGEQPLATQALAPNARSYLAILRTVAQRDQLLTRAPATCGDYDLVKAKLFQGLSFPEQGKVAEWSICEAGEDQDRVVGHVMMRCAAQRLNQGLSEGLVHALTWMMCGTVNTRYMQLAHTVSSSREQWPIDPMVWQQRLEAAIDSASDWPLVQIPRERMDNYRDPVRAKSWSFCVWLLARHPNDWLELCAVLNKPGASQEEVNDLFAESLALHVSECEQEWRAWARKNSAIGKASGWH